MLILIVIVVAIQNPYRATSQISIRSEFESLLSKARSNLVFATANHSGLVPNHLNQWFLRDFARKLRAILAVTRV